MMSCKPKCHNLGSTDPVTGRDWMISAKGNPKFGGKWGISHPQCEGCLIEQIGKQAIEDCMKAKEVGLSFCEKALGISVKKESPPSPAPVKSNPGETFEQFKKRLGD